MPTTTRTIRVFISSTFSDLKAERNALQERVFPRLKRYCQRHGWSFQAIDLRWGISHEAALDQSTMRICRAEIARCQAVTPRPNFVVLLGDRHGWRPLPDEIPATEFEVLLPHLPAALANRWYKLDENAVCPLPDGIGLDTGRYILQPRTGEFKDYDKWFDEVEGPLGDAFRRAVRELGLPENARVKYEASATAQEIHDGAFAVPDANEHVVAFIREIRTANGRPLREVLPRDAALKDFIDLKRGELDHESQEQLDALKQKLCDHLGEERLKTYPARWEGNGASTEHVHRLSLDVLRSLGRLIHAQIKQHSALPPLEEERLRHQEFAQRRARDFTGQARPLGEIEHYLVPTPEPATPLVVHGASGSGKSALLAKAVEKVAGGKWLVAGVSSQKSADTSRPSTLKTQPTQLVYRFIGATANSTDPRSLLEGLCQELGERYGADNSDLPLDLNKLTVVFRERLALATAEKPLMLFLDALDQLQVSYRPELSWLPDRLPPHVRLVVSTIPGPMLDVLKSHLPSTRFLELGPMRAGDGEDLLKKWLHRAKRRLMKEEQWQAIQEGFNRCSLPLYLRLSFEEAQRWRSYDQPPPPSSDVDGLIERLFNRLSEPANHGPLLVERAVSYLRCSRHGLSEDETLDLLANDPVYWKHFRQSAHHALPATARQQTRRLPVVIWSRLYHDLEPYLSWRSADGTALMVFFHTRFNEVADRKYLPGDTVRRARHKRLAAYFRNLADPTGDARWTGNCPRGLSELPYHQTRSQMWNELETTLTDVAFLEAKCVAGMVYDLVADYSTGLDALPDERQARVALFARVISVQVQWLADYPKTTRQQLANYFKWTRGSTRLGARGPGPLSDELSHEWLQLASERPPTNQTPLHIFKTDGGPLLSVALDPTGHRSILGSESGVATIFDTRIGEVLATLKGHRASVVGCALSQGGRLGLTCSIDGTARVLDLEFSQESTLLISMEGPCMCCSLEDQGRFACVGDRHGWVCVVETGTGQVRWKHRLGGEVVWCGFGNGPMGLAVASINDSSSVIIHFLDAERADIRFRKPTPGAPRAAFFGEDAVELTVAFSDAELWCWSLETRLVKAVHRQNHVELDICGLSQHLFVFTLAPPLHRGLTAKRLGEEGAVTSIRTSGGAITAIALTRNGQTVLSGTAAGEAHLWEPDEWFDSNPMNVPQASDNLFEMMSSGIVFCGEVPDSRFVSVDPTGVVVLWSFRDMSVVKSLFVSKLGKGDLEKIEGDLESMALPFGAGKKVLEEWQHRGRPPKQWSAARNAFLSDDGAMLGLVFKSGRVLLCSLQDWQAVAVSDSVGIEIVAGAFSPDRNRVICIDKTGVIERDAKLHHMREQRLRTDSIISACLIFNPEGAMALLGTQNGEIHLWRDRQEQTEIRHSGASPVTACCLGLGGLFGWGTERGELGLAGCANARDTVIVPAHGARVNRCALAPSGKWLASVAQDKTLLIHSTSDLKLSGAFPLPDPGSTLFWSKDEAWLVAGTREGEILILKVLEAKATDL